MKTEIQHNIPDTKSDYIIFRNGDEIFLVIEDHQTIYFRRKPGGEMYRGHMMIDKSCQIANIDTDSLAELISDCDTACQTKCTLPIEIEQINPRRGNVMYHNVTEESRIGVRYNSDGQVDSYFMRLPGIGIIYQSEEGEPLIQHGHSGLEMDVTKAEPVHEQLYMVIKTLLN